MQSLSCDDIARWYQLNRSDSWPQSLDAVIRVARNLLRRFPHLVQQDGEWSWIYQVLAHARRHFDEHHLPRRERSADEPLPSAPVRFLGCYQTWLSQHLQVADRQRRRFESRHRTKREWWWDEQQAVLPDD